MTKLQHTITIARPVDEVWDYVMDARNDPVWHSQVVEVGRGADQPPAVGLELDEVISFLGKRMPVTLVFTEHEPKRRSAIDVRAAVPGRGAYDLAPDDGGTRFTMTVETDAHGFFRLAEPVFKRIAQRDVVTSCERLKDLLEAS
ncbi:MAG TPA: SRPBCC family protein [Solirubrobacteraceae bacterium]